MKIISGGQIGADQGGLVAAVLLGFDTGGWAPAGFRTLSGYCPRLGEDYGLQEDLSPAYSPRTFKNVAASDGTIHFAANFGTPGERCTLRAIMQYRRPYFDVDILTPPPVEAVRCWLSENNIRVLNIAGNARARGIKNFVINYLLEVFRGPVPK